MKHIPKTESTQIKIFAFEEALNCRENCCDYDRGKWVYIPEFYSDYRYILGTKGEKPLITIGINPSTAKPDELDNTLKSVERIRKGNKFDSFLMFNVYAQRATVPKDMDKVFNEELHKENMKAFQWLLTSCDKPSIWAAWGTVIEDRDRPYLKDCLQDMVKIAREHNATWYKAGRVSKKGHPHHSLYLRADARLEVFDVDEYMKLI